ncbi:WD40-repeat-containing domain protein [Chytridium lagenaria]|nr:WD40-repeat-containing domain protein [Chytridium lagenaria]
METNEDEMEIDSYLVGKDDMGNAGEKENYHDPIPKPEALTCSSYEILPYVSAVHPCPIYSTATTRNMKWLFTGGEDGFIRKYDYFASMNGEGVLTQNQKHGLVDSIQKGGVLVSAWELEEITGQPLQAINGEPSLVKKDGDQQVPVAPTKFSPVYSLAVQSEAAWCLAGAESGNINLYTVRHDEGYCQHVLRGHKRPVSVLVLDSSETAVISGGWDKNILLWDLNTGSQVMEFKGSNSQITSASFQPTGPPAEGVVTSTDSLLMVTSFDGSINFYDKRASGESVRKFAPVSVPPWAISACWGPDGQKVYAGRRNSTVDEFDFGEGRLMRNLKLPRDSGAVSQVAAMPNGRHIICASFDNVRLYDLQHSETQPLELTETDPFTPVSIPFTIVPGHHGGVISSLYVDSSCQFVYTTSGSRGWEGIANNLCLLYAVRTIP